MDLVADLRKDLDAVGSLRLSIKVVPRSSRTEIVERMADGALKVKVSAVPEKGRANAALCAYLAGLFEVPKSNVAVEVGHSSSRKRVRVLAAS